MQILTMLETNRVYLMERVRIKRESTRKWYDDIGPKIHKILEMIKSPSFSFLVRNSLKFRV